MCDCDRVFFQERNGLLARRLRQRQRLLPLLRDVQRKQPAQNAADNDEAAATDAADDVIDDGDVDAKVAAAAATATPDSGRLQVNVSDAAEVGLVVRSNPAADQPKAEVRQRVGGEQQQLHQVRQGASQRLQPQHRLLQHRRRAEQSAGIQTDHSWVSQPARNAIFQSELHSKFCHPAAPPPTTTTTTATTTTSAPPVDA